MTGRLFVLYILIAALTLMPVSCTYRDLRALGRTMETDPAAADSLLDEIPVPSCGRSLALYSLLRTQIDYKMYRTAESDSIIRIATDFYGTRYSSYYGALAWYSLGCLCMLVDCAKDNRRAGVRRVEHPTPAVRREQVEQLRLEFMNDTDVEL